MKEYPKQMGAITGDELGQRLAEYERLEGTEYATDTAGFAVDVIKQGVGGQPLDGRTVSMDAVLAACEYLKARSERVVQTMKAILVQRPD